LSKYFKHKDIGVIYIVVDKQKAKKKGWHTQTGLTDLGQRLQSAEELNPGMLIKMVGFVDARGDFDVMTQAYIPGRRALMVLAGAVIAAANSA
jgi:hypothetical protein